MEIKPNINKWALITLKSFCKAKETINKMKRQLSKWEKIIANETIGKGLISKINKQLMQLNTKKTSYPIKKKNEGLNRHFSIEMVHKHMKRCSTSLIVRETQIKTTTRYHCTPVRKAIIKTSTDYKFWWGYGEKGTLLSYWWEYKLI